MVAKREYNDLLILFNLYSIKYTNKTLKRWDLLLLYIMKESCDGINICNYNSGISSKNAVWMLNAERFLLKKLKLA